MSVKRLLQTRRNVTPLNKQVFGEKDLSDECLMRLILSSLASTSLNFKTTPLLALRGLIINFVCLWLLETRIPQLTH